MITVEVINTGSELLLGQVTNTHLGFIARELFKLGLRVDRQVTVPDGPAIRGALSDALSRASVVIVTGGLGPTSDDVTRDIAAELLGRRLLLDPVLMEKLTAYITRRGFVMSATTQTQAMVPEGGEVLPNDFGTAPGLVMTHRNTGEAPGTPDHVLILLPGPPRELKPMWTTYVMPWLRSHLEMQVMHQRTWRIQGVGESRVQELLEDALREVAEYEFGYCARPGEVDFRLISADAPSLDRADGVVRGIMSDRVYAEGDDTMEEVVVRAAIAAGATIATAESCTGGLIGHRLTNVPGSSAVVQAGFITYSNAAKTRDLGVDATLIAEHGAVSELVARALAEGARRVAGTTIAVAATGIAGPSGGTAEKPVGTVWLAVSDATGTHAISRKLSTDRETFKHMASQVALDLLRLSLATSVAALSENKHALAGR
ncbi:MAG: competence/damage-inducible protein A [Candidatus Methylacidiphilales bacterium]|nr:competence/damage-inducible protein A [Candidatus Methylacidiphilales bacterium]